MVTVAQVARRYVQEHPFIQEAMARGVISNAALAEEIAPLIEKELRRKVKQPAIVMALRRLAEDADEKRQRLSLGDASEVTMRSGLVEVTLAKSQRTMALLQRLYGVVDLRSGDALSVITGLHEISVITSRTYLRKVVALARKGDLRSTYEGLASITMRLPKDATEMVGLFFVITKELAWEDIAIIEIVSTWSEASFIVREEDAAKAFEVIRMLIARKER